jgi:hypothetical protein
MSTTKQFNIERAQRTARLIAGTVLSLQPGHGSSWDLKVLCNQNRYDISIWNDKHPQHAYAMALEPSDIISLQVHHYEHPDYNPWKVFDYLVFSQAARAQCEILERRLKQQLQVIKTRQAEHDLTVRHLKAQQINLSAQLAQRQTFDFWRHLGGIVGGVAAIAAAPATGGASLLALPSCGVALCPSGAELQHQMGQQNLDFSRALADSNLGVTRSMARSAIDIIDELETIITNAKHLPWKSAANGNAYGLLPLSIRSDLLAIADESPAPAAIEIAAHADPLNFLAGSLLAQARTHQVYAAKKFF